MWNGEFDWFLKGPILCLGLIANISKCKNRLFGYPVCGTNLCLYSEFTLQKLFDCCPILLSNKGHKHIALILCKAEICSGLNFGLIYASSFNEILKLVSKAQSPAPRVKFLRILGNKGSSRNLSFHLNSS